MMVYSDRMYHDNDIILSYHTVLLSRAEQCGFLFIYLFKFAGLSHTGEYQ